LGFLKLTQDIFKMTRTMQQAHDVNVAFFETIED